MGMNACKTPDAQGFVPMPDGALIRWRRFGREGPAVALLHGNGEDYRCFARMVGPLSRRFSVVAVDSRGHGESTRGQGVTLRRMSDDLARVLAALAGEKKRRARKVSAAYFLIAGVRYWPEAAPCPPMPSYLGALRRRFGQEQAAMAAYLAGAEATEDPCLRQLFWDHAQENWDQACRVRALVEQLC